MTISSRLLRVRRGTLAAIAGTFAVIAAVTLLGVAPAQASQRPTPGWYMLVNSYYDGHSGDDGGDMWCLSTNNQEPTAGSNTHYVYLAVCNAKTPGQWWYDGDEARGLTLLKNYQDFDGKVWELSANATSVYTAVHNSTSDFHLWNILQTSPLDTNKFTFGNWGAGEDLSASPARAQLAGTKGVFPANTSGAKAHVWRYYNPASLPTCSPCGAT